MSEITVTNNTAKHRFEAIVDDTVSAAYYTKNDSTITFTHTEVPPEVGGRGIANELARVALTYAQEHHLRVIPVCPFFQSYLKRHPEFQSLVVPS